MRQAQLLGQQDERAVAQRRQRLRLQQVGARRVQRVQVARAGDKHALAARLRPPGADGRKGLTPREIEILRLISTGLNNQAIAERLFISEHTVHRHVANTLTKLEVSSRSAAVAQAGRLGLL